MSQELNPYENAFEVSSDSLNYSYLTRGRVSSAPADQPTGAHHVFLQESAVPADSPVPVLPSVHGDFYIPPEGSPVAALPFSENNYAVVGVPIPPVETPSLQPGERIISHPLSKANVKFNADGSIDIKGDATIRINGGTQGAITDVQPSGTNSNGGITGLDITREDSILI